MKHFHRIAIALLALVTATLLSLAWKAEAAHAGGDNGSLSVRIITPDSVQPGHKPFEVTVEVVNTTPWELGFAGLIYVGGPAWGAENYGYTFAPETMVYWTECGGTLAPNGCQYYWNGTVSPRQRASFTLPTFSGVTLGTFPLVRTRFFLPLAGEVNQEKSIVVSSTAPTTSHTTPTASPTSTPIPTTQPTVTRTPAPTPVTVPATPTPTTAPTSTAIPTATPSVTPELRIDLPRMVMQGKVYETPITIQTNGLHLNGGVFTLAYPADVVASIEALEESGITQVYEANDWAMFSYAFGALGSEFADRTKVATLKIRIRQNIPVEAMTVRRWNVGETTLAEHGRPHTQPAYSVPFGISLAGDADGDGGVTILDFSLLSSSFNRHQDQQGFDARADFNQDGVVSILDFSILASNFNRRTPALG